MQPQYGFALLPVAIVIAVIASIALLINSQSAMNVNTMASQSEKAEVQYVAQAALQHALWNANNSNCTGYALPSTDFGSHTYSATFTPTDDSPVNIVATGTLANGVPHTLTRNNVKLYSTTATQTTTLQPGSEGEDTYIWDGAHKDTNFGATQFMELNNASAERVALLRFDLSTIPAGAMITAATLELYLEGGSDVSNGFIDAHRVTQFWHEGEEDDNPPSTPGATYMRYDGTNSFALWDNPGGDYDPTPIDTTVIPNLNQGWHQWDVTALAEGGSQSELTKNGVLLRASGGNVDKIKFTSSDGNAAEAPKLTVNFICECGQSCTAASEPKNLLFVVGNDTNLTSEEITHQTLIESWGYIVELIDDDATQAEFDTSVANNDVAFTTNDITASRLNTKLVDATIGVVTSEDNLSDEFGLSSSIDWESGSQVEVNDNTHYITSPFSLEVLTIFSASESLAYVTGTLSPDLGQLASSTSGFGVVTLEAGATMFGGGPAAGRRVQLPWGGSPSLEPNDLTADGLAILQRALEWGSGESAAALGPNAHWKLDDSTGTTAIDSEGGHDGTLTNGPVWVAGKIGNALQFDGTDDYVDLTSDAELDDVFVGGATVMAWIEPSGWGGNGYGRIFDKSSSPSSTGDGWAIRLNTDNGGLNLGQGFTGGRGWWRFAESSINLGTWQHIAVAYDASSTGNDPIVYLNGSSVAVTRVDNPSGDVRSDAAINMRLGSHASGTSNGFDGKIDDARVYDRMLSAAEIADLAAAGGGGGGNNLLLVVTDAVSPVADELYRQKLVESWGYVVTRISDEDSQANFDAAVAVNDLAYITGDALYNYVGTKLAAATIGVAYESYQLNNEFGLSPGGIALANLQSITITDSSHYITSPYTGSVNITTSKQRLSAISSFDPFNTDLQLLASIPSYDGALATFETGDIDHYGEPVAGRRVKLPWGDTDWGFDFNSLSAHGQDILKRSLEWVAGASGGGGGSGCDGTYRDEFNTENSYSGNDGTLTWATDWLEVNESDGADSGDERVRGDSGNDYTLRVRDNDGGGEGVQREADLSAYTNATLSFDYRRDSLDNSGDHVRIELSSNGGSSWTEIDRIEGPGNDSSYLPFTHNISSFISNNTRIRFVTSSTNGGSDEYYFDNVEITLSGCAN